MERLNDFCHLHLLYRIFTFRFMNFINWCTTWSFSCWLKQVMVTWVQPDIKDLFLFCAFLFTSRTCWGLLFLLLANACLFSSLIWSEFDCLRLLKACLWCSLIFSIFSDLFACRALFCLFLNSLFFLLVATYSFKLAFLFCSLATAIVSLLFVVLYWPVANCAGWLLQMKGTVET